MNTEQSEILTEIHEKVTNHEKALNGGMQRRILGIVIAGLFIAMLTGGVPMVIISSIMAKNNKEAITNKLDGPTWLQWVNNNTELQKAYNKLMLVELGYIKENVEEIKNDIFILEEENRELTKEIYKLSGTRGSEIEANRTLDGWFEY